jgi:hypothetical protein
MRKSPEREALERLAIGESIFFDEWNTVAVQAIYCLKPKKFRITLWQDNAPLNGRIKGPLGRRHDNPRLRQFTRII